MGEEELWDEQARADLRETLRSAIVGQLRLANRGHQQILKHCEEVYVQDECPENEWEAFRQFAAEVLEQTNIRLSQEQIEWPDETDSDRLDRVEVTLRERGILLWQVSPCCDTCTCGELMDRVTVIDDRFPGFRDSARGYAFFIDQNMQENLSDSTELGLYFGYGWLPPDENDVPSDVYADNSLSIAREVCQCLHDEGFEVDWDGSFSKKIHILMNWQRRTMLK